MGRAPCCDKANVKRGPWSPEEDATLTTYVETHGTGGNWIALPRKAGLRRCGKSCRLRWLNYLRPDIKHGGFTEEEDNVICTLYSQMGSRWSAIASQLPGRTDNDVKNYWNTKLKKKLMAGKVSLDPMTNTGTIPSTPLPSQNAETQNSHFPASQNQSSSPSMLPILTDASSGFNINSQSMNFDPMQLYCSRFMEISDLGASSRSNHMVSLSQEGSSISDSSSIAVDNKCKSLSDHVSGEANEILMDFGFGIPWDLVNGLYCYEKVGEFAPSSCYPDELVDFSYADIKSQGLNQNVV